MGKTSNSSSRELWGSKWGFIFACISSTVEMGNIWLFPSQVANYGGVFLAAYLIFDILIGFSGVVGETDFGCKTKESPVGTFRRACVSRGKGNIGAPIGGIPMVRVLMLAIGYSVAAGWIFKCVFSAFTGKALSCGADVSNISGYEQASDATASPFGNNFRLTIALTVTSVIIVLGVANGIEETDKAMIPLFFLLLVSLAAYVYFQPGASDGYKYMFSASLEKLKDPMMWVYTLGRSFFSLFLADNGTVIYGSYLSDDEGIVSSAWGVVLFDTLTAFPAALIIVSAMVAAGSTAFGGGPGLMLIYLLNLFAAILNGYIVVAILFVAVLFVGLIFLVNLSETPIATFQDNLHLSHVKVATVIGIIGVVVALCIQDIVSGWIDFMSIYIYSLGVGLAGITLARIWRKQAVEGVVSLERKQRIGGWYYPLCRYGFCILTMAVFILGIVNGGID